MKPLLSDQILVATSDMVHSGLHFCFVDNILLLVLYIIKRSHILYMWHVYEHGSDTLS